LFTPATEGFIIMNHDRYKKATRRLIILILASLLVMALTTWLYHEKGLDRLEDPDKRDKSYYVTI